MFEQLNVYVADRLNQAVLAKSLVVLGSAFIAGGIVGLLTRKRSQHVVEERPINQPIEQVWFDREEP